MNIRTMHQDQPRSSLSNLGIWIIFFSYFIALAYTMSHHELWGDEIHSWNIAKASLSYSDLISNIRYEGHPPVWYTILWSISKFTHDVSYIKAAQLIIAASVVFLVLFFSPFPTLTRIVIPFGYFFLFEYGVLSRNYAIGVLLAFCICVIVQKDFKYKIPLYYLLLFLLSNTHLLAMLLACSLHLYFLLWNADLKKKASMIIVHGFLGMLILLPSIYFIFPPKDSGLNTQFWLDKWSIQQLTSLIQPPLRAFLPIPAWWNYNFWNTEFLLEAQSNYHWLKLVTVLVSVTLFASIFFILIKNKKSLILFTANLFLSLLISIILPLTTPRYAGFIFIGFITSYWLYCTETTGSRDNKWLVNTLLLLQLAGGSFAVIKDIELTFSNAYKVNELLKEVPENKKTVTDYWALNALAAFTDKPFYCLELHSERSYLLWNHELAVMTKAPEPYSNGIKYLFQKENIREAYMVSIHSPEDISQIDSQLIKSYHVNMVDKREGAIEKGSNLYLYQISAP
jgi:hypothetical protein